MQFINSILDKIVKNLSDEDFKYLVEECSSKNLQLLKQKGAYAYEYMNSSAKFKEKNWLLENVFLALKKKEECVMMVKNQMVE